MAATEVDLINEVFVNSPHVLLARSQVITADGNGTEYAGTSDLEFDAFDVIYAGGYISGKQLNPSLALYVETRLNDGDSWVTATSWTGITANGKLAAKKLTSPNKRMRVRWDWTGPGRFTLNYLYLALEI